MSTARDYLQRAEREMSACNCSEKEKKKNVQTTEKNSNLEERLKEKERYIELGKATLLSTGEDLKEVKAKLEKKEGELTTINEQFHRLQMEDVRYESLKSELKELREYKLCSRKMELKRLGANNKDEIKQLCEAYEMMDRIQSKEE